MRAASPSRTPLIVIQPLCTSLPQPQRRRLTCRFGTLCTQGTASPSACGASGQCPGRPRGSAARSWCRKPGPAGHPARRTPSTGRPLNRDREEGCQDHPLAGLCPLPGTLGPPLQGRRGPSTQGWWSQPTRTHLHGLGHVLGTEEPEGLHGLEAAAGGGAGEVVEAGAAGRPARDGGPHPPTVFTFLKAEEPRGVRDAAQGQAEPPTAAPHPPRDPLTCEIPEKTALLTPAKPTASCPMPADQAAHQRWTQQCPVGKGHQGWGWRTPRAVGRGPQCRDRTHPSAQRAALESPARRSRSASGRHPPAPAPGGAGRDPRGARAPPAAQASRAPAQTAAAPAARAGSSPHSCRGRSGGPAC